MKKQNYSLVFFLFLLGTYLQAQTVETRTIFSSDFSDWSTVPSLLQTIPSYDGTILLDPVENAKTGSPSESDQTSKYKAPCIVDYNTHYFAIAKGADKYVKIGPVKNIRKLTFVEGNTGNTRGSTLSIQGKNETVETPVLTQPIQGYTGNAQGVKHVLNFTENSVGYTNDTELTSSDFTFTDAQREEVYLIFRNWQNIGAEPDKVDPGKDSYIFFMEIDAEVTITSTQVSLSTSVSPADAGTIRQSPTGDTFDEGTEITLTATPEFGFEFSKWTDASDNELSIENPYTFALTADKQVKAVFTPKNTYSLQVNVNEGANSYLITATPKGNVIDGVTYYEEGTEIKLVAAENKILTFTNWSDNSTEREKIFTITENVSLTANYSVADFIVAWDLILDEPKQQRAADYYYNSENQGMLSLRQEDGTTNGWLAKGLNGGMYEGRYGAVNWRPIADKFYYELTFSTVGFTNVVVNAAMLYNYNAHEVQKVEYSLDGNNFTALGSYTLESVKTWYDESFPLPQEAWGAQKVYVRFIPDYTSNIVGTSSPNDGTAITDIFIIADSDAANDDVPPVLLSSIPADNATGISAKGSIVLTFDERVIAGTGSATLNGNNLEATFSGKTVVFKYAGLAYNTDYTFSVPSGAITDRSGNTFAGCEIPFKTMERLQPAPRIFDAVVAQDGTGDYTTVIDAIAAVPVNRVTPYLIFIKAGTYKGHIEIPENKPFVHLIGQDVDKVIITDDRLSGGDNAYHVSQGATVVLQAANFYAENISFENSWGIEKNDGPQALALYTNNDKVVLNNCKLRSYQDTYLTSTKNIGDRHYLKNCFIEGAVDFIYGGGDVFFDECTLNIVRKSGGYIVAPSHKTGTEWGYVFMNNTITAPTPAAETSVWLGRPWKDAPKTVFMNTKAEVTIPAAGWYYKMGAIPAVFADYNTMDADGNPLDLSNRIEDYEYDVKNTEGNVTETIQGKAKKSLTDEEAATYTIDAVLSGNDAWDPRETTEATSAPVIANNNNVVSWTAVDYAICYIILKDGTVVDFTTDIQYTANANGNYKVQAVAASGALSTLSNEVSVDNATSLNNETKSELLYYVNDGKLYLLNLPENAFIEIYSLLGQNVYAQKAASSSFSVELQSNSIVRVTSANGVQTFKIIK